MARSDITKLYTRLVATRFSFVPRGEHTLNNVYRLVKSKYPRFCDDQYLCCENCLSIHQQPEWKHTVRSALNNLKVAFGVVSRGSRRGHWRFLRPHELSGTAQRRLRIPKRKRVKPCTKCGKNSFGSYTSSSTRRVHYYCTVCRDERRANYLKRKLANGGTHTRGEWLKKLARYSKCPRCGRRWADIPPRPNKRYKNAWTKDHRIPLSGGGSDDIANIQPLCYQCQFRKNASI
jgi:hypothetical protein